MCELLANIAAPTLRAPSPKLTNLNNFPWPFAMAPWNSLPKPLNITLIEIDNSTSGIPITVTGDIRAMKAKIKASAPRAKSGMNFFFA